MSGRTALAWLQVGPAANVPAVCTPVARERRPADDGRGHSGAAVNARAVDGRMAFGGAGYRAAGPTRRGCRAGPARSFDVSLMFWFWLSFVLVVLAGWWCMGYGRPYPKIVFLEVSQIDRRNLNS